MYGIPSARISSTIRSEPYSAWLRLPWPSRRVATSCTTLSLDQVVALRAESPDIMSGRQGVSKRSNLTAAAEVRVSDELFRVLQALVSAGVFIGAYFLWIRPRQSDAGVQGL